MAEPFDAWSTEQLIRAALAADEDGRWELIPVLQDRGDDPDVLRAGQVLCGSADARERELGVDMLAQGQRGRKSFQAEVVATLLALLADETEPRVLASLGFALGHRRDARAIEPLVRLGQHPDPDVRFAVVHGLSGYEDERAIAALIELSRDLDDDVRDWATFGLGSLVALDTPALRDALAARLSDPDDDTRGEALVGLARRRDPRAIEPLLRELADPDPLGYALDAAEELPHPAVAEALARVPASRRDHRAAGRVWAEGAPAEGGP